ncbi:hypothetical protein PENSPDRAFT_679310 [Peniophora sp. CONT]|nr:hypothetical protein PENSPDRAFT_679310 [Peniophora sp. CONT]
MQLSLTEADINDIEVGFADWVQEFERIYYQYNNTCLSVCTLPLHALLHIANDIRHMGPVWCYWAFPTERFCGSLLPAIKSQKHPYACLDHRVQDLSQLLQIKVIFGLTDDLDLSDRKAVMPSGVLQPGYTELLLVPPRTSSAFSVSLRKKVATYLCTNYELGTMKQAEQHVSRATSLEYGKMYLPVKAAIIHASELLQSAETSDRRDASFVQFKQVIRANNNQLSRLIKKTSYGQVLRFIALTLVPPFPIPDGSKTLHLVLTLIQPVLLIGQNTFSQPHYRTTSASIIVDVTPITDVVGRVRDSSGDWVLTLRTGAITKHNVPEPATVLHKVYNL